MAVTFLKAKNSYSANFQGKQYSYSINKFGPLAEDIANKSFELKKKIFNYIEKYDNYAVMKIYHIPTDTIYDVYIDLEKKKNVKMVIYKQSKRFNDYPNANQVMIS